MASHYLAGKESLKEKNYFVIQLVELVQIVFHLYFLAGQSASQQHIYGFGTQISPQNPAQIPQMVSFIFTKLLHCLNVKKIPQYMVLLNSVQCHQQLSPLKLILQYIYMSMQILSQRHNLLYIILKNSPCICLWTRQLTYPSLICLYGRICLVKFVY